MNTISKLACEQKSFERMSKYQFPHFFKKLGIGLFIICFLGLFINAFAINNETARTAIKYGLLFSLFIVSISKDKVEDERIIQIKMQAFTFAFIAGVFMALIMPFADYLVDFFLKEEGGVFKGSSDFMILWVLLFSQVFCFEMFKRVNG